MELRNRSMEDRWIFVITELGGGVRRLPTTADWPPLVDPHPCFERVQFVEAGLPGLRGRVRYGLRFSPLTSSMQPGAAPGWNDLSRVPARVRTSRERHRLFRLRRDILSR